MAARPAPPYYAYAPHAPTTPTPTTAGPQNATPYSTQPGPAAYAAQQAAQTPYASQQAGQTSFSSQPAGPTPYSSQPASQTPYGSQQPNQTPYPSQQPSQTAAYASQGPPPYAAQPPPPTPYTPSHPPYGAPSATPLDPHLQALDSGAFSSPPIRAAPGKHGFAAGRRQSGNNGFGAPAVQTPGNQGFASGSVRRESRNNGFATPSGQGQAGSEGAQSSPVRFAGFEGPEAGSAPDGELEEMGMGASNGTGNAHRSTTLGTPGTQCVDDRLPETPVQGSGDGDGGGGHLEGTYRIPNPAHLDVWRQRLFDIDGTFMLTEEQFKTYFPHVDNVYSHRSTQKYKRKPFVSHYWDCRLKGRPSGTPKSNDPNKKKRKRNARPRDLCDVKVKITEYFPDARATMRQTGDRPNDGLREQPIVFAADGTPAPAPERGEGSQQLPGMDGARFYTICRVSGGSEGAEDGVPGRHRHTLAESDRIKKSSIQRELLKMEKEQKQSQWNPFRSASNDAANPPREQKSYHKKATGAALATTKRHAKEHELKLFGSCFCPFVQRVWIAMELKSLAYQYIEVDPYKKPTSLLALSPQGLVPALSHGSFSCHESTVLLEYLDDAFPSPPLLGSSPTARAHARLWADHVAKKIVPPFYRTLQAQDAAKQAQGARDLHQGIETLVHAADPTGPFFAGDRIGWVDVVLAPWLLRLRRVLAPYRGWPAPDAGSRWARWVAAVEADPAVRATTSGDELYLDSYERYAENRPNTSQLADAVNAGHPLP